MRIKRLPRRHFIRQVSLFGTVGMIAAGCKPEPPPLTSCQDLSRLSEDEKQARVSLAYVDKTPYPSKTCDNCQFWVAAKEEEKCGGCTILQGPIEAKGYCSSWAPPPPGQGT